ncbi:MAG: cell wall-active antibiotics response protein, partial [Oscillospiraceae bacterium]|nr:cell wall-active antibiotics response protein [Oscillospiraceae bacterium]
PGFWSLFLIIPAMYSMIAYSVRVWNTVVLMLGLYFLLYSNDVIPRVLTFPAILSAIIIVAGVVIITSSMRRRPPAAHVHVHHDIPEFNAGVDYNPSPNYSAAFSAMHVKNISSEFSGGQASAVFGSLKIDLSGIELKQDVVFEAEAVFGSIEIIPPMNAEVIIAGTPFAGSFNSKRYTAANGAFPRFTLRGSAVFGAVKVI